MFYTGMPDVECGMCLNPLPNESIYACPTCDEPITVTYPIETFEKDPDELRDVLRLEMWVDLDESQ